MSDAPTRPRARLPFRPEVIGAPECPILHRWTLGGDRLMKRAPVKILLHHFLPGADDRDTHDHPRSFVTFVLAGGYEDIDRFERHDFLRRGSVRFRPAEHAHRTRVGPRGCWTLVVMGPTRRAWGFWREGRWWAFRAYEQRFGFSFRCESDATATTRTQGGPDA